jgi:hypothetical protein
LTRGRISKLADRDVSGRYASPAGKTIEAGSSARVRTEGICRAARTRDADAISGDVRDTAVGVGVARSVDIVERRTSRNPEPAYRDTGFAVDGDRAS